MEAVLTYFLCSFLILAHCNIQDRLRWKNESKSKKWWNNHST